MLGLKELTEFNMGTKCLVTGTGGQRGRVPILSHYIASEYHTQTVSPFRSDHE